MQYLKHYWVRDGKYLTEPGQNGALQEHPPISGLEVKYWLIDDRGVDYCLSVVPDTNRIKEVTPGLEILTKDEWDAIVATIPEPEPFPVFQSPSEPDWDNFETIVLQSKEIKEFISYASIQNSLVAATFPAAFFEAKTGKYNSFHIVWNELIKISPVDSIVIQSIIGVAKSCHLPEEFIKIIEDTLVLIQDENGNDTLAKMPDWDTFEGLVLQSAEMIEFITFAATKNPLVASAFPASFYEAKNGKYGSFRTVWNELIKISPVDANVSASIIAVAKSCNLPQDFISIVEG